MKKTLDEKREELKAKLQKIDERINRLQREYDRLYRILIKRYPEPRKHNTQGFDPETSTVL